MYTYPSVTTGGGGGGGVLDGGGGVGNGVLGVVYLSVTTYVDVLCVGGGVLIVVILGVYGGNVTVVGLNAISLVRDPAGGKVKGLDGGS